MLGIINSFKNSLISKNIVEENELRGGGDGSNDSSQNLFKRKNLTNLAKPRKLKNYLKLFKSKNTIFDKSESLLNLTIANTTRYLTAKTRVTLLV